MKLRYHFVIWAAILLSLLIPIPKIPLIILLVTVLLTASSFLFCIAINKKIFYPGPKIYKTLLYIIIVLELHFTKNLFLRPITIISSINYPILLTFTIAVFIYNLIVIISFLYKMTETFDPVVDMNLTLFKIDNTNKIKEEEKIEMKFEVVKAAKFYTKLTNAYKSLFCISVACLLFLAIQATICIIQKSPQFDELMSNITIFNFIIFITISIISNAAYTAAKRYFTI